MSAAERVVALRDQLAAHPYDIDAGEFIRYKTNSTDDVIAGVVRSVVAEGEKGCRTFRVALDDGDADTLRLFAMRRVLNALRQSNVSSIYEAMDGFALLPSVDDVPWDSWFKGALFVTRSLDGDIELLGQRFVDLFDEAREQCDIVVEAMSRVSELYQCHLVKVSTNYGTGLVETLVFRGKPTFALFGAPRQADNHLEFHPTTNLAQLAASLADALDASGKVVTGPIGQDQLAGTSFSLTTSGSYIASEGCLSFVAHDVSGSVFTAFVAELPAGTDVAELAEAAAGTNDQVSACDANRLIVLSPQPSFEEDLDMVVDVASFEDFARTALLEPTTR